MWRRMGRAQRSGRVVGYSYETGLQAYRTALLITVSSMRYIDLFRSCNFCIQHHAFNAYTYILACMYNYTYRHYVIAFLFMIRVCICWSIGHVQAIQDKMIEMPSIHTCANIYCSGINATGLIEVEVHYILIRCIVHRYMQELEFRIQAYIQTINIRPLPEIPGISLSQALLNRLQVTAPLQYNDLVYLKF